MRWRVLGPIEVVVNGSSLLTGAPQQLGVLAYLLLNANLAVSTNQLVQALWNGRPPVSARTQVQGYVSRLRQTLRQAGVDQALTSNAAGYRLAVDEGELDLNRHADQAHRARMAAAGGQVAKAAELYRDALALWRGPALGGAVGAFVEPAAMRLHEQRLAVQEDLVDVELAMDDHGSLVVRLRGLLEANPLRQRLVAQLMRALYRDARQADALETFREFRRRLGEEQGLEPAPELVALHEAVLRCDPQLRPGQLPPFDYAVAAAPLARIATPLAPARSPGYAPRQLPAAPSLFVGRKHELGLLDELLQTRSSAASTAAVSAITGGAGVGKTTLALYWAHQMRDCFPDGQLYVNLRGFDPTASAETPSTAIHRLLDAIGVSSTRIPSDLEGKASFYRSMLDGRRMLILLDNARDADQVRPLLPGTPTTLTLITSRHQLSSLAAVNAARLISIDLFTDEEARQLLTQRLGASQVAVEPQTVEQIIARCSRLPLALAIAAARAACPGGTLAAVAADLADASQRLDVLSAGDAVSEIRAVFSWSHDALAPAAAELFRLLGLHPGPHVSLLAAASLVGLPPARTRSLLGDLTRANLLTEHDVGRYAFHDLLKIFASELAEERETQWRRHAAIGQALDHYLHTAHAADRIIDPHRDPITLTPPAPTVAVERPANHVEAMTWLSREHPIIMAMVEMAAGIGLDVRAWQLAWTLTTFLTRRGPSQDLATVWQTALTAADRLGDPSLQAYAHLQLGFAHTELGRYDHAHTHYGRALDLCAAIQDRVGMADIQRQLATLCERQGRKVEALDHARRAHTLYREAGHRHGEAVALNGVGWFCALLGNHQRALVHCGQSLGMLRRLGNRHGQADAWDTMGYAHHHLGQYDRAVSCFQHALNLYRDLGDRFYEAGTLIRLGDTHDSTGDLNAARAAWQQALTILNDLNHLAVRDVDARLLAASSR